MSMWTEETIEKLIELYKEHPSLWDPNNKNYKNRHRKHESLKIISSAMNMEVVDVERKLNVLITQFRRTHKKVLNMKKSGMVADEVERNLWYGYRLLLFLEDRFNSALLRNGTLQKQHEAQNQNSVQQSKPRESTISHPPTATILRGEYPQMKNNLQTVSRPINEAIVLMNNVPSKRQLDKDEYDYYGEQIACKLRKMDEITRINTQHRINCIIHETEMKLLNKRYGCPTLTVSPVPSDPLAETSPSVPSVSLLETDKNSDEKMFATITVKSDFVN